MRLNAPTKTTFAVALIIAIVGVVGKIVGIIAPVEFLEDYSLWAVVVGYIILMLGNTLKGF
jgi:hypothetical protein